MRGVLLIALAACGRIDFDEQPAIDAPIDAPISTEIRGPGTWTSIPAAPLPPTVWTRGAWTGSEFVIFGGALDMSYAATNQGARFDPVTQLWTPLSMANAPGVRHSAELVVSGEQVFTYGGASGLTAVDGGGIYNPATDTWTPIPASDVGPRIYSEIHAVGSRLLVWSGLERDNLHWQSGFIYSPSNGTWTRMSIVGAPAPRSWSSSVFTGDKLLVWGGCSGSMPQCPTFFGDGAIYDVGTDTWTPMATAGAPSPRQSHTAVWTGAEMIVFGGATTPLDGTPVNDGAIYTPATDTWRPLSMTDGPVARADHAAVWLGTKMLVWGSLNGFSDGFLYDPVTDEWSKISSANAPANRQRFAYATDGRRLFVYGGNYGVATGGVWTPEE